MQRTSSWSKELAEGLMIAYLYIPVLLFSTATTDGSFSTMPRPCTLLTCDPGLRHPLRAFQRWIDVARAEQQQRQRAERTASTGPGVRLPGDNNPRVAEIVRNLDRPSRDRSRRDFAVVCDLLRLGLQPEEIWPLVADSSKFESNGRAYFDVTVANAQRCVLFGSSPPAEASA